MAGRTSLTVCNQAIGRVGGEPLEALDEDSPLGVYCVAHYGECRDELLGAYDWRFANTFVELAKISPAPPGAPLRNVFAPPGDLIGQIHSFRDGPSLDARTVRCLLSALGVASDAGRVYAEYTAAKPEAAWPVWFANLVSTAFAARLAQRRPNSQLAQDLKVEAYGTPDMNGQGGLMLTAMQADGRDAPERQLFYGQAGELVDARVSGFGIGVMGRPIIVDTADGG